jgi:hypothetical protein
MKTPCLAKKVAVAWICLVSLSPLAGATAAEPTVSVDALVFATAVESREPVGAATQFAASSGRVYCWTRLSTSSPPATVTHVWYLGDQQRLEVPLTVKYPSGRYWSVKTVTPGQWKVAVVGADGTVLATGQFTVK